MQPRLAVCLLLANFAITSGQIRRRFKLDNNIRRTSKTRGVNGGNLFFDETSGEFKKRPENHHEREESAEIIARTRMRNFDDSGSDRAVNKVLKRRKKYKKLPVQVAQLVNKKQEDESEESAFTKLPPKKNKYKASDTIRMHMRRTHDAKNEEIVSPRRKVKQNDEQDKNQYDIGKSDRNPQYQKNETKSDYEIPERNAEYSKPEKNSDYFKPERKSDYVIPKRNSEYSKPEGNVNYKKPDRSSDYIKPNRNVEHEIKRIKQERTPIKRKSEYRGRNNLQMNEESNVKKGFKLESRENVYEHYDSPEDVLIASGYHNQLSVQDPNYDFTIGDTRNSPSAPADPILNHQFFPTPPPLKYPVYPGLYFPPTSKEEEKNALKNYDFTIGNTGDATAHVNPVLNYLNISPNQPARLPTTPKPFFPTRSVTQTTPYNEPPQPTKATRRSHTTESLPATGRRFPHFPSMEITDNYIDPFNARKSDTRNYKTTPSGNYKTYEKAYTTTTRKQSREQQRKANSYNNFGSQNHKITPTPYKNEQLKSNYFDHFGPKFENYPQYPSVTEKTKQYKAESKYTQSKSQNYYTTKQPQQYARTYQTTVRSPDPYEKENTASEQFNSLGSSNFFSNNNNDFFSDWGKKVSPGENNTKRDVGKGLPAKTTTKPKIKQPANDIQTKAVDDEIYQLKNYRTPVGAYPGMYGNANNQGYNDRVTASGYTTSSYQPNDIKSKYTSYPAPNTQTQPTTIYTNAPVAYTPAPSYPKSGHAYTPIPSVYQNTPRSYIGQPTQAPHDFPATRSHSPSPTNYGHHTTSNPNKLKRGPLKKELASNPKKRKKKPNVPEFGNNFYSGFGGFGTNHIKPHSPAITFLEPSSPSPPEDRYHTQPRPAETQHTPVRDPVNVFNQPAAFDRFFEFANFDQRQMPGESFSQLRHGAGGAHRQQQAANQHHSQYYQQGLRPQGNIPGKQNLDVSEELPRRKRNKQQTSQKLNLQGKRKRKTAQFDNRPAGGYSINVFNNVGKNYSILDGSYNKNLEPTFGNINNPEKQYGAMNKPRQFKRNIDQQGLRTDNSNPWPNDKHWTNQEYESQEFGDDIPFLF